MLARALEQMLRAAGTSTAGALHAWDVAFSELVRQSFVGCADRGELLGRVRRAYDHYLASLVERVRFMEGTERETELRRLEGENAQLKSRLGESISAQKSTKVMGLLRAAASESKGAREVVAQQEKADRKAAAKAGSYVDVCVKAYNNCSPQDQSGVWKDMLMGATFKTRTSLLYQLWKGFGESKKPDLVRNLMSDMPKEAQTQYTLTLATKLDYEERVGVCERLLRQFSAFEMSSFIDFLPYIWDDLSVQFTSKLLSKMAPADRSRIASQLSKEVELAAAKAAADGGSDDAVNAVVAAAGNDKIGAVALDPSAMFPNELPGWELLAPASSDSPSYNLAETLSISAECLELVLGEFAPGEDMVTPMGSCALAATRLGNRRSAVAVDPWPRSVFNVLLRRVPVPSTNQQKLAAASTTTLHTARESLWTLLASLRSHSKASLRAKLFARMCGVVKYEFNERRVELCLKILAHLPLPEQRRFLQELHTVGPAAGATADGYAPAWLPLDALPGLPSPGVTAAMATAANKATALPALLQLMESELGGASRVTALVEKLRSQSVPDPRPTPVASTVIDVDVALLTVMDVFDSVRLKLKGHLSTLHEQLEVQRASGALDASAFISILRDFDGTLSEGTAAAIYVDCDIAAAEERAKELAAARERASAAGATGSAAAVAAAPSSDAVPRHVFVRICEEYGVSVSARPSA